MALLRALIRSAPPLPSPQLCEDGGCGSALLLDARDPRRLFLWAANCPDGPSAMFQVVNTHTVAELNFDARRVSGARNVLVFDPAFDGCAEMRILKARTHEMQYSTPRPHERPCRYPTRCHAV